MEFVVVISNSELWIGIMTDINEATLSAKEYGANVYSTTLVEKALAAGTGQTVLEGQPSFVIDLRGEEDK